jgi:DNA repair protein RecN (Recombination protein N)
MLTQLQVRDFAIIEAVDLEFHQGFSALTGETGAGKSILVDALLLAVGGRADAGAVRHGAERAEVIARFDLQANPAGREWLAAQDIGDEGEVVLRRSVGSDGRSRAWINGQSAPLQSLRALGETLLDVHGQLEFQSLTRRGYQRELLDACGAGAEVQAVLETQQAWGALQAERAGILRRAGDREVRLELLEHYVAELGALAPGAGEAEQLGQERRRVAALGRLADGTRQLQAALGDEGAGQSLARAQTLARQLAGLDGTLSGASAAIDEAATACREALAALGRYADSLEADPERQEWLEARLAAMEAIARKHRVDVAALPALHESLAAELAALRDSNLSLAELDQRSAAAHECWTAAASRLSKRRRQIATNLDRAVEPLLHGLGMPGGRFVASLTAREPAEVSATGLEDVEFLVSANPGQPPRPLARVASGGELSRISLALSVATLAAGRRPCLIFDEVDAGIGGAVAEMVGRLLRDLATGGQVLCVTHLAQVAAQAQHQFKVSKQAARGSTRTAVTALDRESRVEELARMLGGARITERAREHAREMLEPPAAAPTSPTLSARARGAGSSRARSGRAGSGSGR